MSTYGISGAPNSNTINYDAILSTSLFNYQRTLTDNISKSNAFFYRMQENGMYEGLDGGIAIQIPLMYALGNADWYDSYDTLSTDPIDGITSAFFDWRQLAVPISISRREERQNSSTDRIIDLLKSKIMQAELGIKQRMAQAALQGSEASGGTNLAANDVSAFNGAVGVEPLPQLIAINGTTGTGGQSTIGGINPTSQTWWQNQFIQSALTTGSTASAFLFQMDQIYNSCAKGPGGPPDMILTDQYTYQIINTAYYQVYRRMADSDDQFPFENIRFRRALVTWDEFVPDVFNNTTTPLTGAGTAFFINTQFCAVKYDEQTNFVSTPFMRPVNQDARVAHILWMGNVVVSNRRKMGVWYNLPRSLAWTI